MLQITIPLNEDFDERTAEFVYSGGVTLDLEHSLVSLSKWESKHEVPFLSTASKTPEQLFDYVKMMILTVDFPEEILLKLTDENISDINTYIGANQTATTFAKTPNSNKSVPEVVTAELIYYWMVAHRIPFTECQNWHINRLLTLIQICNVKNSKPVKMGATERAEHMRKLNAERRKQHGTAG